MKFKKRIKSYEKKKSRYGYYFIGLWVFGFIFLFLVPLFTSLIYSFSSVKIEAGYVILKNVGLENYIYAFTGDAKFPTAFVETLTTVITQTPLLIVFSLLMAIILNQNFYGRSLVRAIFFLPVIIASGVVINIIKGDSILSLLVSGQRASMMFEVTSTQAFMQNLGIDSKIITFITNSVNDIFNLTWKSGIQILIFLAALQSVPVQLYEVSKVEGATAWETFWKITFPLIMPMIMVNTIYSVIDNYISYSTPVFKLIQDYSQKIQFDSASAMSWINFIVIFAIVSIIYFVFNRKTFYLTD